MQPNLKFLEQKGDVTFYMDDKENMYQQLGTNPVFKVRNGSVTYKELCTVNGYKVKYNNNGVYGYAIFRGTVCLEADIWELARAKQIAANM